MIKNITVIIVFAIILNLFSFKPAFCSSLSRDALQYVEHAGIYGCGSTTLALTRNLELGLGSDFRYFMRSSWNTKQQYVHLTILIRNGNNYNSMRTGSIVIVKKDRYCEGFMSNNVYNLHESCKTFTKNMKYKTSLGALSSYFNKGGVDYIVKSNSPSVCNITSFATWISKVK